MEPITLETQHLLKLASPAVTILLALTFLYLWVFQTRTLYVLMIAGSFFIYTLATLWQLLPLRWPGAGLYGLMACYFYLVAAALLAEAILRHNRRKLAYLWVALFALVMVISLGYFSYVSDQPLVRAQLLSLGCGLFLISIVPRLNRLRNTSHVNQMFFWVYVLFIASCFLCGALATFEIMNWSMYSQQELWLIMQLTMLVFIGMLAIALLLTITSSEIDSLRRERDIDPLTSLLNRRGFYNAAEPVISKNTAQPACVLFCDIDHFKLINDEFGHATGDKVLQKLGAVIRDTVRTTDIAARIGGEEFAILMPGAQLTDASSLAERLRQALILAPYPGIPRARLITGSFGIVMLHEDESLHAALQRADSLMYRAKASGRNQILHTNAVIACAHAPVSSD